MALSAAALATWLILTPGHQSAEAPEVADAIGFAVENDTATPITGSKLGDVVLMAVYADSESHVQQHPKCLSWDCKRGISCGVWQMRCWYVRPHTLREQAVHWLAMYRWARQACPALPGAVLCGSCTAGLPRRMAWQRWATARIITARIKREATKVPDGVVEEVTEEKMAHAP